MVEKQNQAVDGLVHSPSWGLKIDRELVDQVGERLSGP
jgi:hypothetical protein